MQVRFLLFSGLFASMSLMADVPVVSLMSYEDYAKTSKPVPHFLHYRTTDGELCVVGIAHTNDHRSTTISTIWNTWNRFKPDTAYFEGLDWQAGSDPQTIRQSGEAAVVRFLALSSRVPVTSIEPDLYDEISHLLPHWSSQDLRLFYTLRLIAEHNAKGQGIPTAQRITSFLQGWFPSHPDFSTEPSDSASFAKSYTERFPNGEPWQSASLDWVDPAKQGRFTNDIAKMSGRFRDEHMLRTLIERVTAGGRVFLAVGYVHAHMLEPALTKAFGSNRSSNNEHACASQKL